MVGVVGSEIDAIVSDGGRRRPWFDDPYARRVRAQHTPFANLLGMDFFNIPSKQQELSPYVNSIENSIFNYQYTLSLTNIPPKIDKDV
jgi:hypothetical protein